jgi:hypothetical protein
MSFIPQKYLSKIMGKKKNRTKRPYSDSDLGIGVSEQDALNSVEVEKQKVIENE